MRIGLDVHGGDYAPQEAIKGALAALAELPSDCKLVLIGDESLTKKQIKEKGGDPSLFEYIHASDVIAMHEHPAKAFQQKTESSIVIGFQSLRNEVIDAFCSAGNTGAMMVGSALVIKTVEGILRPAIGSLTPKQDGRWGIFLDVGVNADCKPEHLQQFAILGSLYAEHVLHLSNPKVGLMSIGEEEEKGNQLTKEAHQLLKQTHGINFIGNVEGRDLFNNKSDVIVCDGFTGNIMLKEAESFFYLLKKRKISDPFFDLFNYENYGGTPVLGINSTVMIGHGISSAHAFKNMVLNTREVIAAGLAEKITAALIAK